MKRIKQTSLGILIAICTCIFIAFFYYLCQDATKMPFPHNTFVGVLSNTCVIIGGTGIPILVITLCILKLENLQKD